MKTYSIKFLRYFRKITIVLGRGCNNNCHHCKQMPILQQNDIQYEINEEVLNFFKQWSAYWGKQYIKKYLRILFWGGEPLLYFEQIKKIIEILEENGLLEYVDLTTTTNGLALTEDIINYANSKGLMITLSYDGPNETALRPKLITEKQIELFLKLKRKCVLFSWTAFNPSLLESYFYLKEKFPNTYLKPYSMHMFEGVPSDIIAFEDRYVYKEITKTIQYLQNEAIITPIFKFLYQFIYDENVNIDKIDYTKNIMCTTPEILEIAWDGSLLSCRNTDNVLCNLSDEDDNEIIDKVTARWDNCSIPTNCKTCEYYKQCRRYCPMEAVTEDGTSIPSCSWIKELCRALKDNPLE